MVAVFYWPKELDVGNIKGFDVHLGRMYAKNRAQGEDELPVK